MPWGGDYPVCWGSLDHGCLGWVHGDPTQAADGRVAQPPGSSPCPVSMVAVAPFGRSCAGPGEQPPSTCQVAADGLISVVQTFRRVALPGCWAEDKQEDTVRTGASESSPSSQAGQPSVLGKWRNWRGSEFMLEKAFPLCLARQLFSLE